MRRERGVVPTSGEVHTRRGPVKETQRCARNEASASGRSTGPKLTENASGAALHLRVLYSAYSVAGAEHLYAKGMRSDNPLVRATLLQLRGMSPGAFCDSTLPWEDCRSAWAGLSGVLYAAPCLVTSARRERALWLAQACLSVGADYAYVGRRHPIQGLDRLLASFNVLRVCGLGLAYHPLLVLIAAAPLGCFVRANVAKRRRDFAMWAQYHGLWHVLGALCCALVVFLSEARPPP